MSVPTREAAPYGSASSSRSRRSSAVVRRGTSLLTVALLLFQVLVQAMPAAAATTDVTVTAGPTTITLVSGAGLDPIGSPDPNVTYLIDAPHPVSGTAVIIAPNVAYTASIPGARWINTSGRADCDQACPQGGATSRTATYSIPFTLPSGYPAPYLTVQLLSDNAGTVYLNGHRIGQQPQAPSYPNFQAVSTFTSSDPANFVVGGPNTLSIANVDYGGANAIEFRADITSSPELVVNGGFEAPQISPNEAGFTTFPNEPYGPNGLTGWQIANGGSVDLVSTHWLAHEGNQSLDLAGSNPGEISQVLATTPGAQYRLSFEYSANPDGASDSPPRTADVVIGGTTVALSHAQCCYVTGTDGITTNGLYWSPEAVTFTADSPATTLVFKSTSTGPYGITLDNVSVVALTADFAVSAPSGTLSVAPGATSPVSIQTSVVGAPGSVGLVASIAPAGLGVTVSLDDASVAAGGSTILHASASASAAPGLYTATVTGTEGDFTHSTQVLVTVLPPTGIPGLVQAIPGTGATGVFTDSPESADALFLAGMVNGPAGPSYDLTLLTASSCPNGVLGGGATTVATTPALSATIGTNGTAFFGGPVHIPAGSLHSFVAARIGSGPVGPCIVVSAPNDQWPYAYDISSRTPTGSQTSGYVDTAGRSRWYKFTVAPGSSVHVSLTDLPSDYDVFLFKDIGKAYTDLTAGVSSLTQLSAEFASADSANAFSSNAFSSNAFSSNAFSSNAFSSNAFSSNAFSSNAFSSNAFSSNAFSSNAFSSNAFSSNAFSSDPFAANAFSSNAFSSNAFSSTPGDANAFSSNSAGTTYGVDPGAYSSAQLRSLIGGAAQPGPVDETIDGNTWTNTGTFYVRVNGKAEAASLDAPFHLSVTLSGNVCTGVNPVAASSLGTLPTDRQTLVFWDSARMQAAGSSAADVSTLRTTLATFAARGEIKGQVIDLGDPSFAGYARIHALNVQADANKACVYGKNLVAAGIKDIVKAYRAPGASTGLKYVVLVGGDGIIPFFRYPDQNALAPESNFVPPVDPLTVSEASLRSDYVLGQDEYGSTTSLSLGSYTFPVVDLAVGRLVETAADAARVLNAYLGTTGGVVAPNNGVGGATYSSLVTGYDFLADAAATVRDTLNAGTGGTAQTLIAPRDQPRATSWTGTDLKNALTGQRHDLVFLAGHFSASLALAADYGTYIQSTDLQNPVLPSLDLTNSIIFSAGCHSGYNLVDGDQVFGVTQPLDWAQAFAKKGATLIAGTGYQYGDSDFELWSEKIYAEFAHQLRVGSGPSVSIGNALVRSKQLYLSGTPDLQPMDAKALLEATIYGLPMLSVNLPGRDTGSTATTSIAGTPVAAGGFDLTTSTVSVPTATTVSNKNLDNIGAGGQPTGTQTTVTWAAGDDGVVANPGEPVLPLQSEDVTVANEVLRGVGFRGGAFTDAPGVVPLTGAPATELSTAHLGYLSPVFAPAVPWRVNYFDAFKPGGRTNLLFTPAQYKSSGAGDGTSILRTYSSLGVKLFYSHYTGFEAQAAAPSIGNVSAVLNGNTVTFQATVTENPAGIQQVWVTWTGLGSGATDAWASIDLTQSATARGLWTGTLLLTPAQIGRLANLRFMVQAASGVGLVGLDTNIGAYYGVTDASVAKPAPVATTLTLAAGNPGTGVFGDTATVSATLRRGGSPLANAQVTFSIGGSAKIATSNDSGVATASVPLAADPGSFTLTAAFAGDGISLPSGDSKPFTITRLGTSVDVSGPATATIGVDSGVVATLTDANHAPIPFRTIFFVASGAASFTRAVTTGPDGKAPLGTLPTSSGDYSIVACFAGPGSPCPAQPIPDPDYSPDASPAKAIQQAFGTADHLSFIVNPANAAANNAIAPAIKVAVTDQYGNVITTDGTTKVTMSIGTNPGGTGVLSCAPMTQTVTAGVATFDNCWIDEIAHGYTLVVTDTTSGRSQPLNAATSQAFDITPSTLLADITETDADFKRLDGFDVLFAKGVTGQKLQITNPGTFHYGLTLRNETGLYLHSRTVPITGRNGASAVTIITIPGLPTGTNALGTGITAPPGVLSDPNPAFVMRDARSIHVRPDGDDSRDLDATIQWATLADTGNTGNCLAAVNWHTGQPADGAFIRCVRVSDYVIPKHGKAKIDISLEFAWKGTDGWAATAGTAFHAGFSFKSQTAITFDTTPSFAFPSLAGTTMTGSQVAGLVGAGEKVTAIGGFVYDATGAGIPGAPVRLFNSATGASCATTATPVASDVTSLDGFYFIQATGPTQSVSTNNLPSGVQYYVMICPPADSTIPAYSWPARSMGHKLATKEFDEEDFFVSPPTQLRFTAQPSNVRINTSLGTVKVSVLDAFGNVVTGASGINVTLMIGANPGGGILNGTATQPVVNGVATFSGLSITKAGTGYTLTATSTPFYTGAVSSSFKISP